jgi:hypothetical protein
VVVGKTKDNSYNSTVKLQVALLKLLKNLKLHLLKPTRELKLPSRKIAKRSSLNCQEAHHHSKNLEKKLKRKNQKSK